MQYVTDWLMIEGKSDWCGLPMHKADSLQCFRIWYSGINNQEQNKQYNYYSFLFLNHLYMYFFFRFSFFKSDNRYIMQWWNHYIWIDRYLNLWQHDISNILMFQCSQLFHVTCQTQNARNAPENKYYNIWSNWEYQSTNVNVKCAFSLFVGIRHFKLEMHILTHYTRAKEGEKKRTQNYLLHPSFCPNQIPIGREREKISFRDIQNWNDA